MAGWLVQARAIKGDGDRGRRRRAKKESRRERREEGGGAGKQARTGRKKDGRVGRAAGTGAGGWVWVWVDGKHRWAGRYQVCDCFLFTVQCAVAATCFSQSVNTHLHPPAYLTYSTYLHCPDLA